jgi:cytoskeletal protein CcmA (bactofilin family)
VNLVLKPSAVVTGAISYGTVTVESGATVNGKFRHLPAPAAAAAAPAAAR